MLQSQKRASRCREIASKAFLAKVFSEGGPQTPPWNSRLRARRPLKKCSVRSVLSLRTSSVHQSYPQKNFLAETLSPYKRMALIFPETGNT
jgi:hypothetical protein